MRIPRCTPHRWERAARSCPGRRRGAPTVPPQPGRPDPGRPVVCRDDPSAPLRSTTSRRAPLRVQRKDRDASFDLATVRPVSCPDPGGRRTCQIGDHQGQSVGRLICWQRVGTLSEDGRGPGAEGLRRSGCPPGEREPRRTTPRFTRGSVLGSASRRPLAAEGPRRRGADATLGRHRGPDRGTRRHSDSGRGGRVRSPTAGPGGRRGARSGMRVRGARFRGNSEGRSGFPRRSWPANSVSRCAAKRSAWSRSGRASMTRPSERSTADRSQTVVGQRPVVATVAQGEPGLQHRFGLNGWDRLLTRGFGTPLTGRWTLPVGQESSLPRRPAARPRRKPSPGWPDRAA